MLASRLRLAVTRLNRRLRQQALAGISPSQESALATVHRLERPTLGELAQAEQVQPPTMTRIVAAMESGGLVVRQLDPGDRRVSRVELTPQGHAALAQIRTLKNAYLARRISHLDPDLRCRAGALAELLECLVEER